MSESSGVPTRTASADRLQAEALPAASLHVVTAAGQWAAGRAPIGLSRGLFLIGRDILRGDGLQLSDPRLSRVHARIAFDARLGAFRLGDAGSHNGTFVNGQRVDAAVLQHGDVLRLGGTLLVFEHGDTSAWALERDRWARSAASVLILGETGSGKEVAARSLHALSGRRGPFIAVNCASIPAELAHAELFGHAKGAFSGADRARRGLFAAAASGTLFLDEVGDSPMTVQSSLLRALQERATRAVGEDRERAVDVRILAATNVDLDAAVAQGRFRADLHARLAQLTLQLPALRERRSRIMPLLHELATAAGIAPQFSVDATDALLRWHWPYNVRELQSLVHALSVLDRTQIGLQELLDCAPKIAAHALSQAAPGGAERLAPRKGVGAGADRSALRGLLEQHDGNVSHVAAALGKPRAQVYRWMKTLGLSAAPFRR